MRISDWSSDVCSSDLGACSARSWLQSASISSATRVARPVKVPWPNSMCLISTVTLLSGATRLKADRKSVVSGKSVSVRVDLGGRRNFKKKITPQFKQYHLTYIHQPSTQAHTIK